MCRWFAYLGDEPQLLEDVLLRPAHSVVKQINQHFLPPQHKAFDPRRLDPSSTPLPSSFSSSSSSFSAPIYPIQPAAAADHGSPNLLTNMDGFGVTWWSDSYEEFQSGQKGAIALRPATYKNIRPPLNDLVLKSIAAGVATPAVVAHVRAGTGLTPVVETNCHPFTFGRHVFCHNGELGNFHLFKPQLLSRLPMRYQSPILGTTDSEHIAALYFYHLCGEDGDWSVLYPIQLMADAMRKTVKELEELKAEAEERYKAPPTHNALNLLVSSGSSLVALRYASPAPREPPSLYFSTKAGPTLNRKFRGDPNVAQPGGEDKQEGKESTAYGKHFIVASEPTTFNVKEWSLVEPGQLLCVDAEKEVHLEYL